MTVKVVHDFTCPWCWIALFQTKRLREEFDLEIDWIGAELWPEELGWPEPRIAVPDPANKPATKSRFEFLKYIEQIEVPKVEKPKRMRTHKAHLAVEFAKKNGKADEVVEAFYRAYYERGEQIGEPDTILRLAEPIVADREQLVAAIEGEEGAEAILRFDDPAHQAGIYNVPTFFVGEERLAEQPYGEIKAALERSGLRSS